MPSHPEVRSWGRRPTDSGPSGEFGNRLTAGENRNGPAGKVRNHDFRRRDSQVLVDRGQEITGATGAGDDFFPVFIGGTDDSAGGDAAAGPEL